MHDQLISDDVVRGYQDIIGRKFPGALVRRHPEFANMDGGRLAVFNIPDDQRLIYTHFMIEDIHDFLEDAGLPRVVVHMYTVSETRKYYPSINQER